jgi:hypothetical protein
MNDLIQLLVLFWSFLSSQHITSYYIRGRLSLNLVCVPPSLSSRVPFFFMSSCSFLFSWALFCHISSFSYKCIPWFLCRITEFQSMVPNATVGVNGHFSYVFVARKWIYLFSLKTDNSACELLTFVV